MVSFTSRQIYPGERVPGTDGIGGCLRPIAGLGAVEKRKITCPGGNRPADQPIANRCTLVTSLCIPKQIAALVYHYCAPLNCIFLLQIALVSYLKSELLGDFTLLCNLFLRANSHRRGLILTRPSPPSQICY
jgi:hypothetical protein